MTPALKRMTADEFLEWSLTQEERYELIDGRPVLMAGATQSHDRIVVNLILAMGPRLRGGRCRTSTADIAARMTGGNVRRPDVTIDCGRFEGRSTESSEPTVFFEVLSPSTRGVDLIRKSHEYRLLPSVRHAVFIEPDRVFVQLWTRDAQGGWGEPDEFEALTDAVPLPAVGVELPVGEIYDELFAAGS